MPGLLCQILGDTDSVRHFDARFTLSDPGVTLILLDILMPDLLFQILGDTDSVRHF